MRTKSKYPRLGIIMRFAWVINILLVALAALLIYIAVHLVQLKRL